MSWILLLGGVSRYLSTLKIARTVKFVRYMVNRDGEPLYWNACSLNGSPCFLIVKYMYTIFFQSKWLTVNKMHAKR